MFSPFDQHPNKALFISSLITPPSQPRRGRKPTKSQKKGKQEEFQPLKKMLTEEEKAQFRSVIMPQPRYCDRLKQELKQNRLLSFHLQPSFDSIEDGQKQIQRIYQVKRRKDIIKDDYTSYLCYNSGLENRKVAKSFGFGVKYHREVKIELQQNSSYEIMANWLRIFRGSHFQQVKTLSLKMASWYVLERYEGRLSILKSLFSNVENLKVIFTQMHGHKDIPIQDFTLRLIRRLQKLRNLRIEFTYCRFVKDEHLGVISKTFRSGLYSLESLELALDGLNDKVTPKAIENLWKSLDRIPNLKKLELTGGFGQNKINYEAFSTLCDVIQRKSATLLALKIDVGYSELGSPTHQQLCTVLVKLLPRLHHLGLKFVCRNSVTDQSLTIFGDLFSYGSNSLKTLDFQLGTHHGLTTKGARDFAERLKKGSFPMMESLVIYFHMTYDLTHDGLYEITEAIPVAFPNLKALRISYSGCHPPNEAEITEKANQVLKAGLKNLPEEWKLYW